MPNSDNNREQSQRPSRRVQRKKKSKKSTIINKILKVMLAITAVILVTALAYGAKLFYDWKVTYNSAYSPRNSTTIVDGKEVSTKDISALEEPISILVMGIDDNDERNLGSARTDTMIVVTINPDDKKISMVTIPRDTYVDIAVDGYNEGRQKINTAYAIGQEDDEGDDAAVKTTEKLLNIPINYFFTVDFEAFEKVVDALGGIDFNVPYDVYSNYAIDGENKEGPIIVEKGQQTLNGADALTVARMRKYDNDIERGKRQQELIKKMISKATEIGSIPKYSKVITSLKGHFWTDMTEKTMLSIVQSGLNDDYTFENYSFDWQDFTYYDGSYVALNEDSLDFISHRLRVQLGLDKTDNQDSSSYKFESDGVASEKTIPIGYELTSGELIYTGEDPNDDDQYSSTTPNYDYFPEESIEAENSNATYPSDDYYSNSESTSSSY